MWSRRAGAWLLALTLVASGCSATVAAPRPHVVAAFYPFEWLTERVLGGAGSVENLTQPGAEPHDLELTARQVAALATADLVVYQHGFQPAVDAGIAQAAPARVVDLATVVPINRDDPHTWLDPQLMETFAQAIADQLGQADPGRRDAYAANALALIAELRSLDADFKNGLADCRIREFVTTHAAFGYLASRYGLTQIGISGINPDLDPSPARIAEIHDEARRFKVTTVFSEVLASPALAEAIAGDLGLKSAVLDPIEGITPESRGTDYLSVMRANLAALKEANAC